MHLNCRFSIQCSDIKYKKPYLKGAISKFNLCQDRFLVLILYGIKHYKPALFESPHSMDIIWKIWSRTFSVEHSTKIIWQIISREPFL